MRSILVLAVLVFAVSCGGSDDNHDNHNTGDQDSTCTATNAVSITNLKFSPACVTVAPGSTVTFTNDDNVAHTATTNATQVTTFDSSIMQPNATFTTPGLAAGTIKGFCSIHTGMLFEIRVQ